MLEEEAQCSNSEGQRNFFEEFLVQCVHVTFEGQSRKFQSIGVVVPMVCALDPTHRTNRVGLERNCLVFGSSHFLK